MRITGVQVISRHTPSAPALVQVETDEGITGIGAAYASPSAVAAVIEEPSTGLQTAIIGQDPTNTNLLWHLMFEGGSRGTSGEGGLAVNAMAAVDMALWDIAGKARGLPIYKLLGGAVQPQVMAYASTTAFDVRAMESTGEWMHQSTDDLVEQAEEFVGEGFKAVKFGWGNYFSPRDLEALSAIRDAIGPDIKLMLDFGCPAYLAPGWTVKDAIAVSRLLERFDIFFLEEPLRPHDVDGFATLTRQSAIKIATGESLTTVRECRNLLERGAVDVIQLDAQQTGITQFCRVARRAEESGILCIPHGPWTAFTVAAHLNVLATLTNGAMIEYPAFARIGGGTTKSAMLDVMHNKIVQTPVTVRDGYLQLSQRPGLGLGDFVPEALRDLDE